MPADVTLQPATEKKEHYVPGWGSKMFSPGTEIIVSTQLCAASSTHMISWTVVKWCLLRFVDMNLI